MSGCELRLVLVGWGAIGTRLAALLDEARVPVRIVGIAVRNAAMARDLPPGAALITSPDDLAALSPGLVVECAGRASVGPWGRAAFAAGADFAVSSTSAFVEDAVLADLLAAARVAGRQLILPPGALGGIDALAAAARLPLAEVRHEIVKPAAAWAGTAAETRCDLAALTAPVVFFEGTARAAADAFPQNANVAIISSLAGLGLDRTTVALVADPEARLNSHRITARGEFGQMQITLENRPLATNPKSSEMTALSLIRLITNRAGTLVI
jgi:aspartate dehydrogenase